MAQPASYQTDSTFITVPLNDPPPQQQQQQVIVIRPHSSQRLSAPCCCRCCTPRKSAKMYEIALIMITIAGLFMLLAAVWQAAGKDSVLGDASIIGVGVGGVGVITVSVSAVLCAKRILPNNVYQQSCLYEPEVD